MFQIFLPKAHSFTRLVILHYHEMASHRGYPYVLTLVQRRYWNICGSAGALGKQLMVDLPVARLAIENRTFTYTVVDYFGHFEVKQGRTVLNAGGSTFYLSHYASCAPQSCALAYHLLLYTVLY